MKSGFSTNTPQGRQHCKITLPNLFCIETSKHLNYYYNHMNNFRNGHAAQPHMCPPQQVLKFTTANLSFQIWRGKG